MFSHRVSPLLISLVSAALSGFLLLAGAFHGLDTVVQHWLHLPTTPTKLPLVVDILAILGTAGLTGAIAGRVQPCGLRGLLLATTALQPISAMAISALADKWFSPFPPLVAALLALSASLVFRWSSAGRKSRMLAEVFGRNMGTVSLGFLCRQPPLPPPSPTRLTALLAHGPDADWQAVEAAADFFKNRDAWVEIQSGNRLLILFNAPLFDARHPFHAVMDGRDFLEKHPGWHMGLATGELDCGIPEGSGVYQVRGPLLDEVRQLADAAPGLAARCLVNLAAYDILQNEIVLRPLGFLRPGGAEVYEPLCPIAEASPEVIAQRDQFWQGLILQRQNRFREAATAFRQAGDDAVTRRFLEQLTESESRG